MRRWAAVIAVGLALTGCKNLERDRPDHRPADPASRTKPGKGWLDGPNPGPDAVGTPPADSWTDPRDPLFDVQREVRGVLAGFVEDPDGRKVKDAFIEVEPVGAAAGGGAPVGVQTDRSGHFLIRGLKPGQAYRLTARGTVDGRELLGQVYARTATDRSQFVRLPLIEGLTLPGRPGGGSDLPGPADGGKPPTSAIPPPVLPGSSGRPDPILRSSEGTGLPLPDGRGESPSTRPDLTAGQPDPTWRPPAANIPKGPSPGAPPVATPPKKSESRTVRPGAGFSLVDPLGVQRDFPSGRAGELVLLEFLTTASVPSRQAIPAVKGLQAKYGVRGLEVVGVVCDDAELPQRRALADRYQRAERLNYLLYVEPSKDPGAVMKRFGVTAYPTLVLLDGTGEVLWTGPAANLAEAEPLIEQKLGGR